MERSSLKFEARLVSCGLYYKHITVVNDNSSVVNNWSSKLTDDARAIIYDRNMFIVQTAKKNTKRLQWKEVGPFPTENNVFTMKRAFRSFQEYNLENVKIIYNFFPKIF